MKEALLSVGLFTSSLAFGLNAFVSRPIDIREIGSDGKVYGSVHLYGGPVKYYGSALLSGTIFLAGITRIIQKKRRAGTRAT